MIGVVLKNMPVEGKLPTEIIFTINYYQVDIENKLIVTSEIEFG